MHRRLTALLAAGSLLAVAACDDDDPTQPQQFATVRFVNASAATTGALTPQVSAQGFGSTGNIAAYQSTSGCVQVPVTGSNQPITFQSGGTNITMDPLTFNFQPNQKYTVVLFGTTTANRRALVLTDPAVTAPANQNALRFVNALVETGSVFTTTAQGTFGGTANFANLQSGQASTGGVVGGFIGVSDQNTRTGLFTGTPSGTNQTPQGAFTIGSTTLANRVGTIVFAPAPQGGTTTGFAFQPCP